ncbi:MAG: hypothetical protein EAX95_03895 [Candidatus Thorarchaeota archaeon]|nr:hypothetical protein [Candidatus Thorarchaeota archaeon]
MWLSCLRTRGLLHQIAHLSKRRDMALKYKHMPRIEHVTRRHRCKNMASINLLTQEEIERVHHASLEILHQTGISIRNEHALELLGTNGCSVQGKVVSIPPTIVEDCLASVPSSFVLHDREGRRSDIVGGDNVIFNPASSAIYFLDPKDGITRRATARDLCSIIRLVDALTNIKAQSTAVVASDAPTCISDIYRLYVALKFSSKPIVTGAFTKSGLIDMIQLLTAVVGSREELTKTPRAIFDCCPSSILIWSDETSQNLIDCAKYGVPAEIVPAPLIGATSPVTLSGTLAQANAEILSGIVLSQLVNPGAPIVYGGASSALDMRHGTSSIGSIEAVLVACTLAAIGKFYDIPTHAYLGVSDSHVVDAQSGFESGIGVIMSALARINVVSGPGMLAGINCQSLEKLVLDDEICAVAYRLIEGIDIEGLDDVVSLIKEVGPGGQFLNHKHTRDHLRKEHHFPSEVVNRLSFDSWKEAGAKDAADRARERAIELLQTHNPCDLSEDASNRLDEVLVTVLNRYGIDDSVLPILG